MQIINIWHLSRIVIKSLKGEKKITTATDKKDLSSTASLDIFLIINSVWVYTLIVYFSLCSFFIISARMRASCLCVRPKIKVSLYDISAEDESVASVLYNK